MCDYRQAQSCRCISSWLSCLILPVLPKIYDSTRIVQHASCHFIRQISQNGWRPCVQFLGRAQCDAIGGFGRSAEGNGELQGLWHERHGDVASFQRIHGHCGWSGKGFEGHFRRPKRLQGPHAARWGHSSILRDPIEHAGNQDQGRLPCYWTVGWEGTQGVQQVRDRTIGMQHQIHKVHHNPSEVRVETGSRGCLRSLLCQWDREWHRIQLHSWCGWCAFGCGHVFQLLFQTNWS